MSSKILLVSSLLAIALIAGCAAIGLAPADTFNKKIALAYLGDTGVLQSDHTLFAAGKITKEDEANIEKQADTIKEGLDIARSIHSTDATAGDSKLTATIAALSALQNYLQQKQGATP